MAHYKGAASEAGRAMQLLKKREQAQMEIEFRKKKIEEDLKISNIENKFAAHYDAVEQQLKTSTIGLVTLDEMKAKQENIVKERERKLAQKQAEKEREQQRQLEAKQAEKNRQRKQIQALSFANEHDDEEEVETEEEEEDLKPMIKKIKKNPEVDTSFLPDREREEQETRMREELRQEWVAKQTSLKEEDIDITFSYWDGSGHRKTVRMKKDVGATFFHIIFIVSYLILSLKAIKLFLKKWDKNVSNKIIRTTVEEIEHRLDSPPLPIWWWSGSVLANTLFFVDRRCLEILRREFSELKTVTADQLMYVKEDLILPHHYTFYDFIVTKARGKSGPLFMFDARDDVRLVADASIEKEDSHAGKVLLRAWYERNKHIFPASRWEPFDPSKSYDKYTVKDKKKQ